MMKQSISRYLLVLVACGAALVLLTPPGRSTAEEPDARHFPGRVADPALERCQLMNQVIADLMLNPAFEEDRNYYGTPGDREIILVRNPTPEEQAGFFLTFPQEEWPAGFPPALRGYTFTFGTNDSRGDRSTNRRLGILLYNLDFPPSSTGRKDSLYEYPIVVGITNMGG
jgi:hypothetical protein